MSLRIAEIRDAGCFIEEGPEPHGVLSGFLEEVTFVLVSVVSLGRHFGPSKAAKPGGQSVSVHTSHPPWGEGEWVLKSSSPLPMSHEPWPGKAWRGWP